MSIKKVMIFGTVLLAMLFAPLFLFAQTKSDKYGLQDTAKRTRLANIALSKSTPESLIAQIVTFVLQFVGIIFFLLMLYGGMMWMTAAGSTEKVDKAKSILEMAVIGLVIIVASYAISTFIFGRLVATSIEAPPPTVEQ